ncbi:metallophosphoesterase family protein [Lachnospiraceae bacterium MD308]|nr:metallophosphoesterase family protein [Lachnospiraceae bacterium MD308]
MRLAILSDAHGNKPFFEKIIADIDGEMIDKIIYLGDAFGYMTAGEYIYKALKLRNAIVLKGNHEAMLVGELPIEDEKDKIYKLKKQKDEVDRYILNELKSLRSELTLQMAGNFFSFMHGAPFDTLNGYLYEDNAEYNWENTDHDFIFMGHTHRMYMKKTGKTTYVNVGSCGLPRDKGLNPGYCVFDTEKLQLQLKRIKMNAAVLNDEFFLDVDKKVRNVFLRR